MIEPRIFDVKITRHGDHRSRWWTNIEADYDYEAAAQAFAEHDWPERWEYGSKPMRLTVTIFDKGAKAEAVKAKAPNSPSRSST